MAAAEQTTLTCMRFRFRRAKGKNRQGQYEQLIVIASGKQKQPHAHSHTHTHTRRIIVNYLRRCRRSCKANSSRRSRRPRVKCTPSTNEFHFISFRTRTFPTRTHTHTHTHRYLRARHPWRVCIQIGQGYGMKWWPGQIGNLTAGPFRPICRHYFPRLRLLFDCSHVMR